MDTQIVTYNVGDLAVSIESAATPVPDESEQLGTASVGRRPQMSTVVHRSLDEALQNLTPFFDSMGQKIKAWSAAAMPDEMEVKLGIKLTAEAGAVVAKTSAEGNIEVTVRWMNSSTIRRSDLRSRM